MNKLGFLVDDLIPNDFLKELWGAVRELEAEGTDVVIFSRQMGGHPECAAPVLETTWAWGYSGPLVATSAAAARVALACASPCRVTLFSPVADWCRSIAPHSDWASLYGNPRLQLAAPSESLASRIRLAWDREAIVFNAGKYASGLRTC